MILKLLISASILLHINYVAATTCHELQQSQLISLNERMNQMIDTISSLLPKSLKKLTPSVPPASTSSADYLPPTNAQETNYYITPPPYSTPSSTPHVVYMPPSYPPLPPLITPPGHPPTMSTPHQRYTQSETGHHQDYPFSRRSSAIAQPSGIYYQYEQPFMYPNPIPLPHFPSPSYPPTPYTRIQSPHFTEYTQPYPLEYPIPSPTYYNFPTYAPGAPLYPLPVPKFPGSSNISELTQKYK